MPWVSLVFIFLYIIADKMELYDTASVIKAISIQFY